MATHLRRKSSVKYCSLTRTCAIAILLGCLWAPAARADLLYTSSSGQCCFTVELTQISSTEVGVTVTLIDGAEYFVDSGNGGNHPGFAFELDLSSHRDALLIDLSGPWVTGDVHLGQSVITNGPDYGAFNNYIENPGPGASLHNPGPLTFHLTDDSFISINDFIANEDGYYFAADILGSDGKSGMAAISGPITPVPEPTSLVLLAAAAGGAVIFRRRRAHGCRTLRF